MKSNSGIGKSLPILATTHYQEEFADVIDIFSAYNGVDLEKLPESRQNG